jgi:hypothetical protein
VFRVFRGEEACRIEFTARRGWTRMAHRQSGLAEQLQASSLDDAAAASKQHWKSEGSNDAGGRFGDGRRERSGCRSPEILLPREEVGAVAIAIEIGVRIIICAKIAFPLEKVVVVYITIVVEVSEDI